MRIRRNSRRGLGMMAIMTLLSLGMMVLPMITGKGGGGLLGGLMGGGGSSSGSSSGSEAKDPYTARPLPALPSLPELRAPSRSSRTTPKVTRFASPLSGTTVGASAPQAPTADATVPASVTRAPTSSSENLMQLSDATHAAFLDLKQALESNDQALIARRSEAYRLANERFAATRSGR